MDRFIKIAVFAGPSGGHLFPAVAFAESVRKISPHASILLVTSRKAVAFRGMPGFQVFDQIVYLPNFPSPDGFTWRTLRFLISFPAAFWKSWLILRSERPDLCVGFGSYAAYPGLRLASLLKIPSLIHEQNLISGKATQWLARHVDFVATTFEKTFQNEHLKAHETVGLPIRGDLIEASLVHNGQKLFPGHFTILVVGGSQGAVRLNRAMTQAFFEWKTREKFKLAVIHITGENDVQRVTESYRKLGMPHQVHVFHPRMADLYPQADIAVTRAGANTLFELALFRLPAIVIPYPHAGGHQLQNAEPFRRAGAVWVEEEDAVLSSPERIYCKLEELIENQSHLQLMRDALQGLAKPQAANRIAEIAFELMGQSAPNEKKRMTTIEAV